MKKLSTLLAVMVLSITAMAQQISVNEAMQRAAALRPATASPAKGNKVQPALMPMLCHTEQSQGNTLYYVFNYPDGGFAIIGGDNVARPILGYSEQGRFSSTEMPDALKEMLQQYSKEISLAITLQKNNAGIAPSNLVSAKASTPALSTLEGKAKVDLHVDMKTKWNQEYPYNSQLKSTRGKNVMFLTGCVATAGAQMMKFYEYPEKGMGRNEYSVTVQMPKEAEDFDTIFSANFAESTYNWNLMRNTYNSSDELTEEEELAISNLLRDVGVSVEMSYGVSSRGGSGASLTDLGQSLRDHFGYDKSIDNNSRDYYTTEQWDEMLQAELAAGRPVPYRGNSIVSGGHAFIIHGYRASDDSYEINWGWSGHYDGNYPITGVNALNYSKIVGAGFRNEQGMLRNIKPDEGGAPLINVVLREPIVFDNNTHQTTISNRANGGSIRISKFCILNEGYDETTVYYGLECRNIETGKSYIIDDNSTVHISSNRYTYFPKTFNIAKNSDALRENGIYELRPIYRENEEDEWTYMPTPQSVALSTVVVNGGKNNPTKNIVFSIDETTIQDGEKAMISHNEGYAGQVTFSSSNEDVAKVNAQGVITAIAPGKATITVRGTDHGEYRATETTFNITVIQHSVNAVDMNLSANKIFVNENSNLTVTSANYTGNVTYTSSNDSIAVVTPDGMVIGKRPGVAYIMAKAEGTKIYHSTTRFFDVTVKDTVALEEGICFYEPIEANNDGMAISGQPMYFNMPIMNNSDEPQPAIIYLNVLLNERLRYTGYWGYSSFPANYSQSADFDYSKYIAALANVIRDGDILRIEFYKDPSFTEPLNIPSVSVKVCMPQDITYTQPANRYGTLMLAFDADVPAGLKAYECNGYTNTDALLKEVSTIKANTPYIIYGTLGDYTFSGPLSNGRDYVQGNGFLMGKIRGDVKLTYFDYIPSQTRGISSFACYRTNDTMLPDNSAFIQTDYTYLAPYVMLPKLDGEELQPVIAGDADADGKVTMQDAKIASEHYLNPDIKIDINAADINEDGKISIIDANAIINSDKREVE